MNRLIAIVLAISVLCANTGWTMSVHYCMGERVGVSLAGVSTESDTHECPKCGMKKAASKKGCCEDEHIVVKEGDAAFTQAALQFSPVFVALLPVQAFKLEPRPVFSAVAQDVAARPHGPPIYSGPRLHLRHCVFLI